LVYQKLKILHLDVGRAKVVLMEEQLSLWQLYKMVL
jgi:hypothetical protein